MAPMRVRLRSPGRHFLQQGQRSLPGCGIMPEPGLLDVQQRDQFLLKFQNQPVRFLRIAGQIQRSQQVLHPLNAR